MKKYCAIVVLAFMGTAFANDQRIENNPKFQLLAGELALVRKNIPEAMGFYEALSQQNRNPFIVERQINLFFADGKGKESLPIAEQFVKENPEDIDGFITLAMIYLERAEEPKAIQTFHTVAKMYEAQNKANSSNSYIYIYQGLKDKEKPERLARIFEGLVQLDPESMSALTLSASLLIDEGRSEQALVYLNKALTLDPKDALIYSLFAYAYSDQNRVNEALAMLEGAIKIAPSLDMSFEYLKVLVADFQYDKALAVALKINEDYPKELRVWERLAFLHYALGDYAAAKKALEYVMRHRGNSKDVLISLFAISTEARSYEEILEIVPVTTDADITRLVLINRAHIALVNKEYTKFLEIFDELRIRLPQRQFALYLEQLDLLEKHQEFSLLLDFAIFLDKITPENFVLHFYKAMGYWGLNNFDAMEKVFRDWLRKNPEDVAGLNSLGYMLIETDANRLDEGLALIERAHINEPNDSAILDSLGWAYFKKGDLDKAELYLTRAYNKTKQPEIIAHYILLLDKQAKTVAAKALYTMLKKIYPKSPELEKLEKQLNWS